MEPAHGRRALLADPGDAGELTSALLTPVLCLLLGVAVSFALGQTGLPFNTQPELALVPLALVGRVTLGLKAPKLWEKLWVTSLSVLWLSLTVWGLWQDRSAFQALTAGGLELACAYAWRASFFLGLMQLLLRRNGESSDAVLMLLAVSLVGALVWLHPQQAKLIVFPLALALGCLSLGGDVAREQWALASAEILEMLSLQMVAWTVVLAVVNPLGEALAARWLDATFSLFATSVSGWIFSGLLWGASTTLRRYRAG